MNHTSALIAIGAYLAAGAGGVCIAVAELLTHRRNRR